MRLACCLIAFALLAPAAAAQEPAPPTEPPSEPAPAPEAPAVPDLVLSGRSIRMTRVGVANVRIGCRSGTQPTEACIGTLTLRLATAVTIDAPRRPGQRRREPRRQRVPPYNLGTRSFQVGVGGVATLKLRMTPRTQMIVRQLGSVPLRVIGVYVSRAGAPGQTSRGVTMYFPRQPPR
jgi:hypothetical protein